MKVLVTGASGFVGRHLCPALKAAGHQVAAAVRTTDTAPIDGADKTVIVGDIGPDTDWRNALQGQDAIIHLAARAHVMNETAADPESLYARVNVEGTLKLVSQAEDMGVRRLIFLSSVKVNGERTDGEPYNERSPTRPEDAYGRTKAQAEQLVRQASHLSHTIVRTPLIYGPGVKGNVNKLFALCARATPLPLASVHNQRSLIYVGNLTDALIRCLENERAIGNTYFVSDGGDVSTPGLIRDIAKALGRPARLLPFPVVLLRLASALLGKTAVIERLCGSLCVDIGKIQEDLGWTPPHSRQQGLEKTAVWFHKRPNGRGA